MHGYVAWENDPKKAAAKLGEEMRPAYDPAINVADLKLYVILRSYVAGVYDHIPADVFAGHPKLLALHAAVDADPRTQGYFAG